MATEVINYEPAPTINEFIKSYRPRELFYDWLVGPVGGGKTTGLFFKLAYLARLQRPSQDGIRRTRAVIVRNTNAQLQDTTIASWFMWFKHGIAGTWFATRKDFLLKFGDVECEVLFRPLDTPEDVARVLSLEVTFAICDEFVQLPKPIIDALSARCGRYPNDTVCQPSKDAEGNDNDDGGATNWGMWGASNTSTEDNWWYDYLHNETIVEHVHINETHLPVEIEASLDAIKMRRFLETGTTLDTRNVRYFVQPSGFSKDAENISKLPGRAGYYTNQAKGKTEAWIKQFIEVEWGWSIAGKPVVPSFKKDLHVAKQRLNWDPARPLVVGLDPGLGGTAAVFGQEDLFGRLLVFAVITAEGYGAKRFIAQKFRPFHRHYFPNAKIVIAPDPASKNRGQRDEVKLIAEWEKYYDVQAETNNRLPLRIDALDHYCTTLTDVGPALLIDPFMCQPLIRALGGGWRFKIDQNKGITAPDPEKNAHSHVGDGGGYLARYFFRQGERNARYKVGGARPFVPPRAFGPKYHLR